MSLLPRLPKISWNVEMFAHSLLDGESQGNKTQCSKLLLRQNIVKTTNPKWPTCHQWTHMTGNPYKRHPIIDPDIVILSSMSNWWTLWSRLCLVGQAGLPIPIRGKKESPCTGSIWEKSASIVPILKGLFWIVRCNNCMSSKHPTMKRRLSFHRARCVRVLNKYLPCSSKLVNQCSKK